MKRLTIMLLITLFSMFCCCEGQRYHHLPLHQKKQKKAEFEGTVEGTWIEIRKACSSNLLWEGKITGIGSEYTSKFKVGDYIMVMTPNHGAGTFSIKHWIDKKGKTFDAIYSNKVLHHLTDDELKTSIKRQSDILNDGGIICHSFWKGEDHKYFENMYVNYHTNKEIETLFSVNFEILTMENYQEFEENDSIFFIGRKIY